MKPLVLESEELQGLFSILHFRKRYPFVSFLYFNTRYSLVSSILHFSTRHPFVSLLYIGTRYPLVSILHFSIKYPFVSLRYFNTSYPLVSIPHFNTKYPLVSILCFSARYSPVSLLPLAPKFTCCPHFSTWYSLYYFPIHYNWLQIRRKLSQSVLRTITHNVPYFHHELSSVAP